MKARMTNPVQLLPGAMEALQNLTRVTDGILSKSLEELVHLRASQINGCSVCTDMHSRALKKEGEPDAKVLTIAAWRETPYFSDEERAALALTEAVTRIADRPESISDEVWEEAAKHFDEKQMAALVMHIAGINTWNRINAATRQPTGEWVAQYI